jgi:hypothetical protein
LQPLSLASDEAAQIRAVLDAERDRGTDSYRAALQKADESLRPIEQQLRELTRLLLKGIVDEDTYCQAKEELVMEKTRVKQERQRLSRSRELSWFEPARELIDTLETLGKTETVSDLPEISRIVQKIGTNHHISRKNVSFAFAEKYAVIPSLLASARVATSNPSLSSDDNNWWSTKWCAREDLNLHPFRDQILSLACMPFHHSRKC